MMPQQQEVGWGKPIGYSDLVWREVLLEPWNPYPVFRVILVEKCAHFFQIFWKLGPFFTIFDWLVYEHPKNFKNFGKKEPTFKDIFVENGISCEKVTH